MGVPVAASEATDHLIAAVGQLATASSLAGIADIVKRTAWHLVQADGATFVLRDGTECHYLDEDAIAPLWKGRRFPLSACISGWSMLHRQQAVIPDIYSDDRIPRDAYRPTFVRSLVMTPVGLSDSWAAIGVYWARTVTPTPEQARCLQALADSTAVAMESVRLRAQLAKRAGVRSTMRRVRAHATSCDLPADAPDPRGPVVHVVDDDPSFLRAVTRRLEAAGFQVEAFDSARAFLARSTDSPGCAVLDLRMPGPGGLDVQEALLQTAEPLPVIFLTGHGDVQSSVGAMKRGAVDFLTKPVSGDELVHAVRRAIALDTAARSIRRTQRQLRGRYETLTARERQVFALVVRGLLNRQIAGELGVSQRTVKAHRAQVLKKMGVRSVVALARAAERLVEADSAAEPASSTRREASMEQPGMSIGLV